MSKEPDGILWKIVQEGVSTEDVKDTLRAAEKNLPELSDYLKRDELRDVHYYESKEPIIEIVVQQFDNASITRNRYGALVLNAPNVFFGDVDLNFGYSSLDSLLSAHRILNPEPISPDKNEQPGDVVKGKVATLKARKLQWEGPERKEWAQEVLVRYKKEREEQQNKVFPVFAEFHQRYPELAFRVYETAAGYRMVVTNKTMDPRSEESGEWHKALKGDKLYARLCERQKCYRARLTPKPWRLLHFESPDLLPDGWQGEATDLVGWLENYEKKSKGVAVCRLLESYGDGSISEDVAKVLKIHDDFVLGEPADELA